MSTVRISELPVTTTLNDDDFIVLNTQNIVTQGIETADFIESFLDRDLTYTGDVTFDENVTVNKTITVDGFLTCNNTVIFNDEVFFNNVTNLEIRDLADVQVGVPADGQALVWDGGASKWKASTVSSGGGGGTTTPGGVDTTIQFNNGGAFDGNSNLNWQSDTLNTINLNATGNTTLGSTATNRITLNGRVDSDLIPFTTDTYSIGDINRRWDDLWLSGAVNFSGSRQGAIFLDGSKYIFNRTSFSGNFDGAIIELRNKSAVPITIETPDTLVDYRWVLPGTQGNAGEVLTNDGAGNLSWTSNGSTSIPFQNTAPLSPNTGDLWLSAVNYKLYVYDGSWVAVG